MLHWLRILLTICLFITAGDARSETAMPEPKAQFDMEVLRDIAILDNGRQKPLDTFARETVRFVTGRERFAGFDPVELLLSWLTRSYDWENLPILLVDHGPLSKHLRLPVSEKGFMTPSQLRNHAEFNLYLQTVADKQQEGGSLSEMERHAGLLSERIKNFYQIAEGSSLNLVAAAEGGWESLAQLSQRYPKLSLHQAAPTLEARIAVGTQGLLAAYYQGDSKLFMELGSLLKKLLREQGEKVKNYPTAPALEREIHFNQLKPFRLAWLGYGIAFFIFLLGYGVKGPWLNRTGIAVLAAAFAVHGYGILLRVLISGRAPVTNMYETVIWVPFGMVLFALILTYIYRVRYYLLAASGIAALALILAENAPTTLDPSIDPLVPVLRNNYWLTVHVLTITLSYAAFTLAMGVGNIAIGYYLFKPYLKEQIEGLNQFIYRAIQIGVVFLAAGTILGGVWANASWGRFWGWDPKEVWALIALLGYLAILHGRYAGWIKSFGLAVGSVLAYLLVLMAWYGVNFILGVGLHSYGFSSGGAVFVSTLTAFELAWVGLAMLRYKLLLSL
jgi:cytochrome c-type biogenesis protein CcsB